MTQSRIVAVIDVGSNSVRLLVARQLNPSAFEVVDEARFDARLGQGQVDGNLSPEGLERGLRAMRIVSQVARSWAPSAIVAVGTEALRRAPNAEHFIDRVHRQTGIRIRVLTGEEEAAAGFLGVINSTSLTTGYLLDIGGGSLELMRVEDRTLVTARSAPLGAIYATERYLSSDPPSRREIRALRKAVHQEFTVSGPLPILYGTGGAVRNLARIARLRHEYPVRRLHGFTIPRRQLTRLAGRLASLDAETRRRFPGLSPARADILPAAAIVIDELMSIVGAETLTVAGQGLREGLVWQELRGEAPVLPDVRAASIAGLARANGVDELLAEPVVAASAALFQATVPRHGLTPADLELLLYGARLSGIGMHVDYYNRERHAEYLVHSGDLHGFTHRETVLLAALIRWSASGTPDLTPYRSVLEPEDPRRIQVLTAILGTARAVTRRHPSPVHEFAPVMRGPALRLRLKGGDGLDAEIYELERQQKRLETALKLPVRVELIP